MWSKFDLQSILHERSIDHHNNYYMHMYVYRLKYVTQALIALFMRTYPIFSTQSYNMAIVVTPDVTSPTYAFHAYISLSGLWLGVCCNGRLCCLQYVCSMQCIMAMYFHNFKMSAQCHCMKCPPREQYLQLLQKYTYFVILIISLFLSSPCFVHELSSSAMYVHCSHLI